MRVSFVVECTILCNDIRIIDLISEIDSFLHMRRDSAQDKAQCLRMILQFACQVLRILLYPLQQKTWPAATRGTRVARNHTPEVDFLSGLSHRVR